MRSIRRSLELTNKRHIILTGGKGTGKSTLFRQLLADWSETAAVTAVRQKDGVYWTGSDGNTVQVGVYDEAIPGRDRKMRPVEEGFRQAAKTLEEVTAIDEIGYLEPAWFLDLVEERMRHTALLAVVRTGTPFLQRMKKRRDVLIVDLDGCGVGCVIMASGLGKRFGGNKLMANLGGKPVVQWAMDESEKVFDKTVVVTRHKDVATLCRDRNVSCVLHSLPHRSDTVRLGVQELKAGKAILFWPGDQPFVSEQTLYTLALCAANDDAIWRLGGKSPAVFPRWAFEELCDLPEGKGGNVLMEKYPEQVKVSEPASSWEVRDIDTPEDLSCFCAGICCN